MLKRDLRIGMQIQMDAIADQAYEKTKAGMVGQVKKVPVGKEIVATFGELGGREFRVEYRHVSPYKGEMNVLETDTDYQCEHCMDVHELRDDAIDCCPDDYFYKTQRYACDNCDEVHEDREDAINCCADPEKVIVYICPNCDDRHSDMESAYVCCGTPKYKEPKKIWDKKTEVMGTFNSRTVEGMTYTVVRYGQCGVKCNCWGFTKHKTCRHVESVIADNPGLKVYVE